MADNEQKKRRLERLPSYGLGDTFVSGNPMYALEGYDAASATDRVTGAVVDNTFANMQTLRALGNAVTGDTADRDAALAKASEYEARMRKYGPEIQSFSDAAAAGGGFTDYAKATGFELAKLVPDIGMSVVGGLIGSAAAPGPGSLAGAAVPFAGRKAAVSLIREIAERELLKEAREQGLQTVAKEAVENRAKALLAQQTPEALQALGEQGVRVLSRRAGGKAGMVAGGLPQAASGMQEEIATADQGDAAILAAGATVSAALNVAPIERLLGKLGKPVADSARKTLTEAAVRALKEANKQGLSEGSTEVMQAAVERGTRRLVNENVGLMDAEAINEYLASAVAGYGLGAILGGGVDVGQQAYAGARQVVVDLHNKRMAQRQAAGEVRPEEQAAQAAEASMAEDTARAIAAGRTPRTDGLGSPLANSARAEAAAKDESEIEQRTQGAMQYIMPRGVERITGNDWQDRLLDLLDRNLAERALSDAKRSGEVPDGVRFADLGTMLDLYTKRNSTDLGDPIAERTLAAVFGTFKPGALDALDIIADKRSKALTEAESTMLDDMARDGRASESSLEAFEAQQQPASYEEDLAAITRELEDGDAQLLGALDAMDDSGLSADSAGVARNAPEPNIDRPTNNRIDELISLRRSIDSVRGTPAEQAAAERYEAAAKPIRENYLGRGNSRFFTAKTENSELARATRADPGHVQLDGEIDLSDPEVAPLYGTTSQNAMPAKIFVNIGQKINKAMTDIRAEFPNKEDITAQEALAQIITEMSEVGLTIAPSSWVPGKIKSKGGDVLAILYDSAKGQRAPKDAENLAVDIAGLRRATKAPPRAVDRAGDTAVADARAGAAKQDVTSKNIEAELDAMARATFDPERDPRVKKFINDMLRDSGGTLDFKTAAKQAPVEMLVRAYAKKNDVDLDTARRRLALVADKRIKQKQRAAGRAYNEEMGREWAEPEQGKDVVDSGDPMNDRTQGTLVAREPPRGEADPTRPGKFISSLSPVSDVTFASEFEKSLDYWGVPIGASGTSFTPADPEQRTQLERARDRVAKLQAELDAHVAKMKAIGKYEHARNVRRREELEQALKLEKTRLSGWSRNPNAPGRMRSARAFVEGMAERRDRRGKNVNEDAAAAFARIQRLEAQIARLKDPKGAYGDELRATIREELRPYMPRNRLIAAGREIGLAQLAKADRGNMQPAAKAKHDAAVEKMRTDPDEALRVVREAMRGKFDSVSVRHTGEDKNAPAKRKRDKDTNVGDVTPQAKFNAGIKALTESGEKATPRDKAQAWKELRRALREMRNQPGDIAQKITELREAIPALTDAIRKLKGAKDKDSKRRRRELKVELREARADLKFMLAEVSDNERMENISDRRSVDEIATASAALNNEKKPSGDFKAKKQRADARLSKLQAENKAKFDAYGFPPLADKPKRAPERAPYKPPTKAEDTLPAASPTSVVDATSKVSTVNLKAAIKDGRTVRTDTPPVRERAPNEVQRTRAQMLSRAGYVEIEPGLWKPAAGKDIELNQKVDAVAAEKPGHVNNAPILKSIAEEVLGKLGIGATVTIEAHPKNDYSAQAVLNDDGSLTLRIGKALKGEERIEVLFHELGHFVLHRHLVDEVGVPHSVAASADSDSILEAISVKNPALGKALRDDFDTWRASVGKTATRLQARIARNGPARAAGLSARTSAKAANAPATEYDLDFQEWFSDNVAKALSQDADVQGVVAKFFKNIAAKLKALYDVIVNGAPKYSPAPSVQAMVKGMMNRNVAAVKAVTGTTPTQAQANTAVHAAVASALPPPKGQPQTLRELRRMAVAFRNLSDPDARSTALRVIDRPEVAMKLFELYGKDPDIMKWFESSRTGPEMRMAAAYFAWLNGDLSNGAAKHWSAFTSARELLAELVKVAADGHYAQKLFEDISSGRVAAMKKNYNLEREVRAQRGQANAVVSDALKKFDTYIAEPFNRFIKGQYDRAYQSGHPTLRQIAALLKRPQGASDDDRGMIYDMELNRARFLDRAADAVENLNEAETKNVMLHMQKGSPTNHSLTAKELEAATKLAALFKAAYDYQKPALGVLVGKRTNYFPVVLHLDPSGQERLKTLLSDPKFEQPMRDALNNPKDDAGNPLSADALIDRMVAGVADGDPSEVDPLKYRFANKRLMQFIYDIGTEAEIAEFAELQSKDMAGVLSGYIDPMVRKVEYARRFGIDGAKLERMLNTLTNREGASPETVQFARDMVDAAVGRYGVDGSPTLSVLAPDVAKKLNTRSVRNVLEGLQAYQNLRLLPLATLSSIVDPMGIAVRSGGDFKTAWKGFKDGIKSQFSKAGRAELQFALKQIDALRYFSSDEMLHYAFGGGRNAFAKKLNSFTFKYNALSYWTALNRGMGVLAGHSFLLKHTLHPNEHSERYMRELKLKPGDVVPDPNRPGRVLIDDARGDANERVKNAIIQFADEALLRPNAQQAPLWHSDPFFGLVSQYKSFGYAIWDQMGSRISRETSYGNWKVWLPALGYVPIVLMAEILRELIMFGTDGNPARAEWGPTEYLSMAADRTGLAGPQATFLADIYSGKLPIGPLPSQTVGAAQALIGHGDLAQEFEEALPANPLYKHHVNPLENAP